ncbi:hypothetical protein V1511DRAFT_505969 [Dipodascopsis uninucleata]
MCGRYSLNVPLHELQEVLRREGIELDDFADDNLEREYFPSTDVRPTTYRPVVYMPRSTSRNEKNNASLLQCRVMRWGFVPSYQKKIDRSMPRINARSENLGSTRMWNTAIERGNRCIVPADGYYEWLTNSEKSYSDTVSSKNAIAKIPYYIHYKSPTSMMYFAGLYSIAYVEDNSNTGLIESDESNTVDVRNRQKQLYSFSIVTTSAIPKLKFIHDRMPLLLEAGTSDMKNWLDPEFKNFSELRVFNNEDISSSIAFEPTHAFNKSKSMEATPKVKCDNRNQTFSKLLNRSQKRSVDVGYDVSSFSSENISEETEKKPSHILNDRVSSQAEISPKKVKSEPLERKGGYSTKNSTLPGHSQSKLQFFIKQQPKTE